MMSEEDLDEIVQITVEDFAQGDQTVDMLDNHDEDGDRAQRKRRKLSSSPDGSIPDLSSIRSLLGSLQTSICQRLECIESKLQAVEATCKAFARKLDTLVPGGKSQSPIQVPMVAGSPQGATQTWNKVRCVVPQTNVIVSSDRPKSLVPEDSPLENLLSNTVGSGRRQNTILVKVPGPEDSQDDQDSGSEASDSVSNSGNPANTQNGQTVTLITLNSEEDFPAGTWLGDDGNMEMRVRCPISGGDMLHVTTNCRTAEKMALTLLDYLFHREIQAMSNLSGQGKHGKKQLDPLMIYGIRCHLFYKFGIGESDWYRIKQSIDSKCRTAWRRKQRGQSLAVKSFSKRTPRSSGTEGGGIEVGHMEPANQQTLHYALANQQVQIHRIGEDGQVQVIPQGQLHIAQVPQGEEVQITQDSEGNLQIHQVHVGQDGQVLRGAQLIAVASADGGATAVEGSALPPDIQVQYVQLAPVAEHTTTVQAAELAEGLQEDLEVKEALQGAMQAENGEVVQIVSSIVT